MKKEIVKYDNKLNNLTLKSFSKRDLDFFYAICSKVRDRRTEVVELSFDEIKEITEYNQSQDRFLKELDRMNSKLMSCGWTYEDDTMILRFNLFRMFCINKTKEVLEVCIEDEFMWIFNDLTRNFTSFELSEFVNLKSVYSKKLYRILKQWKTKGKTPEYKIDIFKELLGTPKYAVKDLTKEIIKPAIQELDEKKIFKNLKCEPVYAKKRGKPIIGYFFTFEPEDLQISFSSLKDFDQILEDMSDEDKKATLKTAKNIVKSKKNQTSNSKNNFNKFPQRNYNYDALEEIFLNSNND